MEDLLKLGSMITKLTQSRTKYLITLSNFNPMDAPTILMLAAPTADGGRSGDLKMDNSRTPETAKLLE